MNTNHGKKSPRFCQNEMEKNKMKLRSNLKSPINVVHNVQKYVQIFVAVLTYIRPLKCRFARFLGIKNDFRDISKIVLCMGRSLFSGSLKWKRYFFNFFLKYL